MSQDINIVLTISNEEIVSELMADAMVEITRSRINELPEHLRLKAYEKLLEAVKSDLSSD